MDTEKDLSMDGLTLRYAQQNAEVNGKEVELTDIEFNILSTLMKHPKQIFSAEQLYEKAWNEPYYFRQIIQSWFIFVILERKSRRIPPIQYT